MKLMDVVGKNKVVIMYDGDLFVCELSQIGNNRIPASTFDNEITGIESNLDVCAVKSFCSEDVRAELDADISLVSIDGVECSH